MGPELTGERATAAALRASEERFRTAFAEAPNPMALCDLDGRFLDVNDAFCATLGYARERLLGSSWAAITHPRDRRLSGEWMRRLTAGEVPSLHLEKRYRHGEDGHDVWAEVSVSVVRAGERHEAQLIVQLRDVTEARGAERERTARLQDRVARAEAEVTASLMQDLQSLTDAALGQLELDDLLGELLARILALIEVDAAVVLLADPDDPRVLLVRATRGLEDRLEAFRAAADAGLAGRIASERAPVLLADLAATDVGDELAAALRERGMGSLLGVALRARGRAVGALVVAAEAASGITMRDGNLLHLASERVGLAIEHAQLYEREHEIAATLQRSLLPERLPDVPGVELAARYSAAGLGRQVGGDFYDVFETESAWALVMGDVCGKGAPAAALTALSRYTLRAAARDDRPPAAALRFLNEAMLRQVSDRRFATVVYGRLEPGEGRARVTLSSGGHPLPMVVRGGGAVEEVGEPGTLVGVFDDPKLSERRLELASGDALVLYTDGILEARGEDRVLGRGGLREALREAAGAQAAQMADRLVRSALAVQGGRARDDIAVLVVRVP